MQTREKKQLLVMSHSKAVNKSLVNDAGAILACISTQCVRILTTLKSSQVQHQNWY